MSTTTTTISTTAFPWCCIARLDSNETIVVGHLAGSNVDDSSTTLAPSPIHTLHDQRRRLDLTTSSDWMEYVEVTEDRSNDEGGAGAYDTFRCDLILAGDEPRNRWRKWGVDFHLIRLQNSYRSLVQHDTPHMEKALNLSHSMIDRLLQEAEMSDRLLNAVDQPITPSWEDTTTQLVRITLLWSPSKLSSDANDIVIRGHACCSGTPVQLHGPVPPIVVTLAAALSASSGQDWKDDAVGVDRTLPTRFNDPQNKVASWTRLRKSMEHPNTYKPAGVSEVLMVRPLHDGSDIEILEGLSSNVFVIYKDATIRTAQQGVLFGYVRHLVLECLDKVGLTLDTRPIRMHEAKEGLWKEAFITSSSRLIYPISTILMHAKEGTEFEEFWSDPALTKTTHNTEKPYWQLILNEILRKEGYPRLC